MGSLLDSSRSWLIQFEGIQGVQGHGEARDASGSSQHPNLAETWPTSIPCCCALSQESSCLHCPRPDPGHCAPKSSLSPLHPQTLRFRAEPGPPVPHPNGGWSLVLRLVAGGGDWSCGSHPGDADDLDTPPNTDGPFQTCTTKRDRVDPTAGCTEKANPLGYVCVTPFRELPENANYGARGQIGGCWGWRGEAVGGQLGPLGMGCPVSHLCQCQHRAYGITVLLLDCLLILTQAHVPIDF